MLTTTSDRFAAFADECVRFVKEVGQELGDEVDPIEEAQRSSRIIGAITKKWTVPIVYLLYRTGQLRFSRFRELLMGISSRTLSLRLKDLEGRGWVKREVVKDRPPRVLYSLTERGITIAKMAGPMYLYIRLLEGEREGP
ncbi:MAG: winged helix-turn-helix transcriptional regulator [Thermoplasmata archaeon]